MPIYIYRCENCGVQFERRQSFNEPALTRCPECEKNTLRKVYQPVGIVFKGSGFYATDHRSPSGASRPGEKSKSDEGESTSSDKTSSETATSKKDSTSNSADKG